MWRAIRHGLDGRMIDFERGASTRRARSSSACWRGPRRRAPQLSLDVAPWPSRPNGSQRQRAMIESGAIDARDVRERRARDARDLFRGGAGMSRASRPRAERGGARAAFEEQLRRLTPADVILQAAVSLINLGGPAAGARPVERRRARPRAGARRDRRRAGADDRCSSAARTRETLPAAARRAVRAPARTTRGSPARAARPRRGPGGAGRAPRPPRAPGRGGGARRSRPRAAQRPSVDARAVAARAALLARNRGKLPPIVPGGLSEAARPLLCLARHRRADVIL